MDIEKLISQMTLKQKIEQLNQINITNQNLAEVREKVKKECFGSLILASNATAGNTEQDAFDIDKINELQKIAMEEHGIPILFGRDVIHGHHICLPVPLALAASFNPDLVQKGYSQVADAAKSEGVNWSFAPMLDVSRDPRWGRIIESPGEDPYLGARMAEAVVKGFQGEDEHWKVAACAKHYIGYGASEGGRDYHRTELSPYSLQNYYLTAFRAAVEAGVGTVMNSFNEISGEPTASSRYLLTDVLRGQLGFEGLVVSDWGAILQLIRQGVAEDEKMAAELAINAGIDMDMVDACYLNNLEKSVQEGKVSMETINTALKRILYVKEKLQLFEKPYFAPIMYDVQEHRETARELAEESAVLLKNDGILPLDSSSKLCVIGEMSKDKRDVLGSWSLDCDTSETVTIFDGIHQLCEDAFYYDYPYGIDKRSVPECEAVIVVIGEGYQYTGEANSIAKLEVDDRQKALIQWARRTRKKVIGIMAFGRPRTLEDVMDDFDAVLYAWHGGSQIGNAVANILFGRVSPSGKLPVTMPRSTGQVPIYYNCPPSGRDVDGYYNAQTLNYWDEEGMPLFPFGYGLSYAEFVYGKARADKAELSMETLQNGESFEISVAVTNNSDICAKETVQCYVRDCVASMTRPIKELKAFKKLLIKPRETKEITFKIGWKELGFYNKGDIYIVEKGAFKVYIGENCLTENFVTIQII